MIRRIIHIDDEKCNGCGACSEACHEGAIKLINGKAKLMREDYCDGLGDCLPSCPMEAISFVEREAQPYDSAAVTEAKNKTLPCGCPGSAEKSIHKINSCDDTKASACDCASGRLQNWPVQIKLASTNAAYFNGANLLVAADCTAYAYGAFHEKFIKNRVTLIGCPKLDGVDYTQKLTEIIRENDIKSLTVVRMEVPCCGGLEYAATTALKNSGKFIPWQVVTISAEGEIL